MPSRVCDKYAIQVASLAVKSLLYEVSVTPKPGLVDRANNGSHADMDYFTFIDSATALYGYYADIAKSGADFGEGLGELLPTLRQLGRNAERDMFFATDGVNTHKGVIFSLGVICAAAGYMHVHPVEQGVFSLLKYSGEIAASAMEDFSTGNNNTNGANLYRKYGIAGIRGEAAAGFPNVRDYGYPILCRALERGCSMNDAGVITLLHLMARVEDTNMVVRGGREVVAIMQSDLKKRLAADDDPAGLAAYAAKLDAEFIQRGISPGGCADLLAICYMMHFLFNNKNGANHVFRTA